MLKEATVIYESNLINLAALTWIIVNKSSIDIKELLYQLAKGAQGWDHFVQIAEEVSWISYSEKILSRVETQAVERIDTVE